jgi:integrase/recombinase XerC
LHHAVDGGSVAAATQLLENAAQARTSGGRLLRYADGRPIIHRRYDHLWTRIGRHLPLVATQGISTHWIRVPS